MKGKNLKKKIKVFLKSFWNKNLYTKVGQKKLKMRLKNKKKKNKNKKLTKKN